MKTLNGIKINQLATMFPSLSHGLRLHLSDARFTRSEQAVYFGTCPAGDGWVAAVIRIDNVISETEASWLGARIHGDLLTHLCFSNQEEVPPEAVDVEHGVPEGGVGWSVAVYVTLASSTEAKAMKTFLIDYVGDAVD